MSGNVTDYEGQEISKRLQENVVRFQQIFRNDIAFRSKQIKVRLEQIYDAACFYMDGMVNSELLNDAVVRPLLTVKTERREGSLAEFVRDQILFASEVKTESRLTELLRAVLYGDTVLFLDGSYTALIINTKGWETRSIEEPEQERILQGPREGFGETAMQNLAMLRRKLLTPDLCMQTLRIGSRTDTQVYICYLDSLVNRDVLRRVTERLHQINMDGVLDVNYLAEQMRNHGYTPFKTVGTTERPDVVAARLLEGRVAVMVDGSPVVMTAPYLFSENFQSDEDYYLNFLIASLNRIIRYIGFFISVTVPGFFVAAVTFHKEMLPTALAITDTKLRSGVPFPLVAECLLLLLVFEVLKESGVRMPQSLGHALSVVGGLVVGEAAVSARLISAPMLIIVALSGISGLMIPRLETAAIYMKLILVIAASLFGFYGFIAVLMVFLIHILSLESVGISYTVSLRKIRPQNLKDTVIRVPWNDMTERPPFSRDRIRMRKGRHGI
ncbi:MAG: spore germination protein [Clostridia bacterium]|nr:spore germination protein [Clostridia bacterium]